MPNRCYCTQNTQISCPDMPVNRGLKNNHFTFFLLGSAKIPFQKEKKCPISYLLAQKEFLPPDIYFIGPQHSEITILYLVGSGTSCAKSARGVFDFEKMSLPKFL